MWNIRHETGTQDNNQSKDIYRSTYILCQFINVYTIYQALYRPYIYSLKRVVSKLSKTIKDLAKKLSLRNMNQYHGNKQKITQHMRISVRRLNHLISVINILHGFNLDKRLNISKICIHFDILLTKHTQYLYHVYD